MDESRIIGIISLNEEKPNTCGSCKHSDNDLGFVSLRCQIIYDEALESDDPESMEKADFAKVRSWHNCSFDPERWEIRDSLHKQRNIKDQQLEDTTT